MKSVLITKFKTETIYADEPLTLQRLYELLNCSTIDIVTRKIGGKALQIIVDDEGLLKPNYLTAQAINAKESLYGNILITAYEQEGEQRGLTELEIEAIYANIASSGALLEGVADYVLRYSI